MNSVATLCIAFCIGGCAHTVPPVPTLASVSSTDTSKTLEVLNEVNDGKRLYVTAKVMKQSQDGELSVVRLRALKNGERIGEAFARVGVEENGEVKISTASQDLTDYQLDLLWGKEAIEYVKHLPLDATVMIKDVHLLPPVQGKKTSIAGVIQNNGVETLSSLTVLLQMAWVPEGEVLDTATLKAEDDIEVPLPSPSIEPGQSRPFAFELETELPQQKGGEFQPVIKVKPAAL